MVPMIQDEVLYRLQLVIAKGNFLAILQAAQKCGAQQIVALVLQKIVKTEFSDCTEQMVNLIV
jgi:hypothetical protein